MFKRVTVTTAIISSLITLSGCSNPALQAEIDGAYQNSSQAIDNANQSSQQGSFNVYNERYVDTSTHVIEPAWMKRHVSVNATNTPLNQVVNSIFAGEKVKITYLDGVGDQLVSLKYNGNLKGALRQIMHKNNINYNINSNAQNQISWSLYETKTFDIAYLPGSTSFNIGSKQSSNSGSSSSLKGVVKGWSEIKSVVSKLLSKTGKYDISQATSTITVIDKPLNVQKVEKFIIRYNNELSKRVAIKVKILDVRLDKQHKYGIDWNIIYKGMSWGGLTGNTVSALGGYVIKNTVSSTATDNSDWSGTSALIQALDQQGKTSVVDEPTITTLNNQPSTIAVNDNQAYVKSSEATVNDSAGDSTIQYTVTPGNIKSGLNLTLIPHIQNNKIYLSIDGSLSTLKSLTERSFGYKDSNNAIEVELPDVATKNFNQRVMAYNNHIIVLSGLKTKRYISNNDKNFGTTALGSNNQQVTNDELVVLIQPHILGN